MYQESEVINLCVSIGVLIFIVVHWKEIDESHHFRTLVVAFGFLFAASIFTLIEDFWDNRYWFDSFNFLEHLCDLFRSVFLLIWLRGYVREEY